MLKDKIKEFEKKHFGFDFNKFLVDFEQGLGREKLCEKWEVSEQVLRRFVYSLGLDFVKSKREASVIDFKYKLGLENGENINLVHELNVDVEKFAEKNRKLYKSLILARDEANRLRKEAREEARVDNITDNILESFNKALTEFQHIPSNKYEIVAKPLATQRDGLVLVLSDEHFGSVETKDVSNNNFNYDVARRRLEYMVEKVISNPLQSYNLVVFELLDVLQGIIHNSEYLSEDGFTTSLLKVVEVYTDLYTRIASAYDRIDVYVTGDNHSRTTQKPSSYMKWDNFGIMTMKMLDMVLKARGIKNVHFYYTKSEYHLVNINDAPTLVFHADTVRRYNPTNQTERANLQAICLGMFDKPYKHAVSGHIHRANASMNEYGGYNISNGTLVGAGQYGVSNGFASINATQTILYFNTTGDIEQISFVNLSDIQ